MKTVIELENRVETLTQTPHAIAFCSKNIASFLLAKALDLPQQKRIIASPVNAPDTLNMFLANSVQPTWCDVKLDGNIDEKQFAKCHVDDTTPLLVNHFAGKPANMSELVLYAKQNNLTLIEDCGRSLGASFKGQPVGSFGVAGVFDIFGGVVVTHDDTLAKELHTLRQQQRTKKQFWNYDIETIGFDVAMDSATASHALHSLQNLEQIQTQKDKMWSIYDEAFAKEKLFLTQPLETHLQSTKEFYPIILNPELHCPKEDIFAQLQQKGINISVHYKPLYQLTLYEKYTTTALPVVSDFYKSELSLPIDLGQDTKKIAQTFLEVVHRYSYRGCSF